MTDRELPAKQVVPCLLSVIIGIREKPAWIIRFKKYLNNIIGIRNELFVSFLQIIKG